MIQKSPDDNNGQKVCFVVATKHDYVTGNLEQAAQKACDFLEKSGYIVVRVYGAAATAAEVYAALWKFQAQEVRIALVSISAHGDDEGVYDSEGKLIINKKAGSLLRGAVVVLQSCLENGEFPKGLISGGARACIGYSPALELPVISGWRRFLPVTKFGIALAKFNDCVCAPKVALANAKNAGTAKKHAEHAWDKAADELVLTDMRAALVFERNAKNLAIWGDRSAGL